MAGAPILLDLLEQEGLAGSRSRHEVIAADDRARISAVSFRAPKVLAEPCIPSESEVCARHVLAAESDRRTGVVEQNLHSFPLLQAKEWWRTDSATLQIVRPMMPWSPQVRAV